MRRAFVLAACLLMGGSGVALADRPAASGPGSADVTTYSTTTVSKGRLGLVIVGLTDELKSFFGSGKSGALVGKVEPGSPAAQAGVKVGDVLADVDGKPIEDAGDVLALLAGKKKGDAVALTIVRAHFPMMLTAKLTADAPALPPVAMMRGDGLDPRAFAMPGFGGGLDDDARWQQLDRRLQQLEHRLDRLEAH